MAKKNHMNETISNQTSPAEVLKDYSLAWLSRKASLLGRKEVLNGKAKFGIFGDGKEVAQLAMARVFRKGDWRSGYYRDQTFAFATGISNVKEYFAQLYAHVDLEAEPASGGRQMNGHFATRYLDERGNWKNQLEMRNCSADMSPTGSQMPRSLGLAYASKLYRQVDELAGATNFSQNGDEICFATIGNATTSEGMFWETLNAAGVLQVPLLVSVWDDGFGISVPNEFHTIKRSISRALQGFQAETDTNGIDIYVVRGSDYPALCATYEKAAARIRATHMPALIHVTELTQPQGHSTSGSHERYKTKERLAFEEEGDAIRLMGKWMIESGIATAEQLSEIEKNAEAEVERLQKEAWRAFQEPIIAERDQLIEILTAVSSEAVENSGLTEVIQELKRARTVYRRNVQTAAKKALVYLYHHSGPARVRLEDFTREYSRLHQHGMSSQVVSESEYSPLLIPEIKASYPEVDEVVDGRQVIQKYFDMVLARDPRVFIVGEDVGHLGGVNLEFEGLSAKHGKLRVTDTSIREMTIVGQGIGAAMRGLRPIADIQYLDYLLYAFQILSDDVATLRFRTAAGQTAPLIVRTKGHRLEGVWHTGSPMGTLIHGLRGMHVCVPRNMVQAVGMYQTLMQGDDPALVIEVLNGYRVKEKMPSNIGEFTVPLGKVEVLEIGTDVTVVTYGACIRIVQEAMPRLRQLGISIELIDVQTLLPFDLSGEIVASLKKTNAVLFMDEDVPGGATSYLMQQVLEVHGGYSFLDSTPRTLAAQQHRGAYSSDGDYYSKPNAEDVVEMVLKIMHERDPNRFHPLL